MGPAVRFFEPRGQTRGIAPPEEDLNGAERKFLSLQTRGEATRQRTKMAAPSEGQAFAAGVEKNWGAVVRSPEGTPQKVRQLIDEGIAPEEGGAEA